MIMLSMRIRKAVETDLPSIVALWVEIMNFNQCAIPFPLVEGAGTQHGEFVKQRLDSDKCLILVAELDGCVVGYCRSGVAHYPPVYEQQPYGTVAELVVAHEYRRCGIGRKLYERALEWFQSQSIKRVEVGTATRNPVSNAFWGKMGFETFRETKQLAL
jgi:ribosomal protein S18 acetylase RimI-like enzyme